MKVSYKWLNELIPLRHAPSEVGDMLTAAGVAVDEVKSQDVKLCGAKTGRIASVAPHPYADKLLVCSLDMGTEVLTIVTGASNVKAGQVVPVAVLGTVLPDGKEITPVELRGVMSYGMLLSADEMQIERKVVPNYAKEGIYILPPETPIGQDVCEVMGLLDYTIELDLTPNRSDCLSLIGVAHEVAALTEARVHVPLTKDLAPAVEHSARLDVQIENYELCPAYLGLVVEQVVVAESPLWMQNRLRSVGIRPVNSIVDITNYVMWELGQPLHAFDYDKIGGQTIVVRPSRCGESIVTLDGEERQLPTGALVIADQDKTVAIAGVMGSLESEVTAATRTIVLESAHFDRTSVRRTSRSLGLITSASTRFDKGIDPEGIWFALSRTAFLIEQLGFGVVAGAPVGCLPPRAEWRNITLRVAKVNSLLATQLSSIEITNIMQRLGFVVTRHEDTLEVAVPSRRRDISEEVDLVEEVGRIHGLAQIPTLSLTGETSQGQRSATGHLVSLVRRTLQGLGVDEVVTLSFADPAFAARLGIEDGDAWSRCLRIRNPLSRERSLMRGTLISGMLEILEYNQARQVPGMAAFEIGRAFVPCETAPSEQPEERLMLSLGAYGLRRGNWLTRAERLDFFFVKGIVDSLLPEATVVPSEHRFMHPGRQADIVLGGQVVGFLGELHPRLALKERFVVCEIEVEKALGIHSFEPRYRGMAKSLPLERDLAFLVPQAVKASDVCHVIRESGCGQVVNVTVFDVYSGPGVPSDSRSMALRLELGKTAGSFTELELVELMKEITQNVEHTLGATLRGSAGS